VGLVGGGERERKGGGVTTGIGRTGEKGEARRSEVTKKVVKISSVIGRGHPTTGGLGGGGDPKRARRRRRGERAE